MVTKAKKPEVSKLPGDWDGEGNLELSDVIDTPGEEKPAAVVKALAKSGRIKIVLEDNDSTPPGGIFVGCNGVGYQIQPGVEVSVPEAVLHVLDCAIMSVPLVDNGRRVVGYKDRLRFPYRIITDRRPA